MMTEERPKYVPGPQGLEILAAAGIPISKNTYYEGLRTGRIPSLRVGKKFFVREDIVELMELGLEKREGELGAGGSGPK